jgi:hypothetical protein
VGRLDGMATSGGGQRIARRGRMLDSKKQKSKEKGARKA